MSNMNLQCNVKHVVNIKLLLETILITSNRYPDIVLRYLDLLCFSPKPNHRLVIHYSFDPIDDSKSKSICHIYVHY